jgi:hypothetical protein
MKTIVIISACLALVAHKAFSQGTINFSNRSGSTTTAAPGQVTAPVYGIDPLNPTVRISGNTATGVPAGSTSYGNSPYLANDGIHTYVATLWALSSSVPLTGNIYNNNLLQVTVNGTASFRTSTSDTFAGIWRAPNGPAVIPGVTSDTDHPFLQVRVWDTKNGTVNSWSEALNAWQAGQTALGVSDLFQVPFPLGGIDNVPPNMQGLQSFNVILTPEPSVIGLGALGAGCMLLIRRRLGKQG